MRKSGFFSRLAIAISLLFFSVSQAQILQPVKWTFSSKKISDTEAELIFKATIEDHWHLYSQNIAAGGPEPTQFTITPSKSFEKVGKVTEGKFIEIMDPNFAMIVKYFEHSATFKQKIKLLDTKPFKVKGNVYFMVCDDKQCLPPEELEFEISVDGATGEVKATETSSATAVASADTSAGTNASNSDSAAVKAVPDSVAAASAAGSNSEVSDADRSIWSIFFEGFGWGLAALLTPCVFPMIPMNVSFFLKRSKNKMEGIKNAMIYALFIVIIYVALGFIISKSFGPDALNAMSTDPWFNVFFFVLLLVFAASFLGAFEIVLPSSFINKVDAKSERGGLIGIFFMAFTLSLVSFSCTGPLIGTALVRAATTGQVSGPVTIMAGFASGLAIPFGIFAFFPALMNTMPKSGGWLNSVKVVLGFLELALALKFASNADLVVQAGILTREVFLALWIIIFGLLGVYLMGWIKLSHDSDMPYLGVGRLFAAIITFSFTLYLVPGLWGAPLKLISGFPPPDFYSESPMGIGKAAVVSSGNSGAHSEGNSSGMHCPNDLPCFHDYDEALAEARKTGKPLLIDFTGWACVNCRKMESQVWTDPEVDRRLRNDVILVSLYVDDKRELPAAEQHEEMLGGKKFKIKTIGNKWSYMQAFRYKTNSQPQYIMLDHNEEPMTEPTGYDPDIQKYIKWLDDGKAKFAATATK